VEKLATILYAKGLREGDVVAAFIGNDRAVEWALLLWTSWRIGAVFAPIEPSLLARKTELREVRRLLDPKVVVCTDGADAKSWTETSTGQDGQLIQVVCSGDIDTGSGEWSSLSQLPCPSNSEPSLPLPASNPTQPAMIMFTSGTTSTPKGCRLTFANIHAEITGYHAFAHSRWSAESKFLATSSVFRPICYLGSLNAWTVGGSVIFAASTFDPATTIAVLVQERATHLMMLPTQLRAVTNIQAQQPSTLQHELLFVTVAGDASDWELLSSARQALKAQRLVPHWGMSEGAPLFAFASVNHASVLENGVPSVGCPLPGTRAKICPAEGSPSTRPVPRGVQGELHVASPALIHSYLDNVSSASFYEDAQGRWFCTGDLAVMDQEGMVYVVGRIKDTIKCRGIGIYPPVMERCLMDLFGVEVSCLKVGKLCVQLKINHLNRL
jgi:acyl-CoA synthetase (AMP-forming)/AMP-acid ligase II